MRTHPLTAAAAVLACALFASTPRIVSVSPSSPARSHHPQTLSIGGENFLPGLTLTIATPDGGSQVFRGSDIISSRDGAFQVSIALTSLGTYVLVVTNPDGGVSDPFPLKVQALSEGPVIDTVTPSTPGKRPDPQILQVDGKRFMPGLTVNLIDPTGEVTNLRGNDIRDVTPNGFRVQVLLGMEGEYTLTVTNPTGEVSNAVSLTVTRR